MPFLEGEVEERPRPGFLYWSDDGDLMALRYGKWKFHFVEQRAHGLGVWEEPFVRTRVPTGADDAAFFYNKEKADRLFLVLPAVAMVGEYLKTFEEFPPRQRPASFSIDQALEKAREKEAQMHAAATPG